MPSFTKFECKHLSDTLLFNRYSLTAIHTSVFIFAVFLIVPGHYYPIYVLYIHYYACILTFHLVIFVPCV